MVNGECGVAVFYPTTQHFSLTPYKRITAMNKLLVTLIAGLFASAAFAQAPALATPAAPAKSVKSDAKVVKPVVKTDTPIVAGAQDKTIKASGHHAKAKPHPVQAKADTQVSAPK